VQFTGIDILRIENGKVVARWDELNTRAVPYV
jgi:predicted SnoaL-like aldol condensation-catalyzing enzyme